MAAAQRTTATLLGSLTDPSGAAIPNAKITVTNEQTGAATSVQTDSRGEFTATFLQVGRYDLQAQAPGFQSKTERGISLGSGQQFRVAVTLPVGAESVAISVTSDTPLAQNGSSALQATVTTPQLRELPQQQRDFTSLLPLQNGVKSTGQGLFQINGLASGGISVTVDGVDASGDPETPSTSMFQGFNLINVISEDAIQEVAVNKGVVSAEVGRTFSGNINIISKGGTNQFHGAIFELFQNDVLNARNAFLSSKAAKPPVRLNQYGGSLNGPILRNKLFFLFAFEGLQKRTYTTYTNQVSPTQYFVNRATAALPAYGSILSYFPIASGTSPTADSGRWSGTGNNIASDSHIDSRLDYHVTGADIVTVRYIHGRPSSLTAKFPVLNSRQYDGFSEEAAATYIHSKGRWANEVRFGYNWSDTKRLDQAYASGVATIKINSLFNLSAEYLQLLGYSWTAEDVVSRTFGRHTLKFGGIFVKRAPQRYDDQLPMVTYANSNDFVSNIPNQMSITFGTPHYHGRAWELGGFVQDDYRVTTKLLLNLGFRWDYFSVFKTREGNLLYNPVSVAASLGRPIAFRPSDSIYDTDKFNPEPRLGFVYSPTGKDDTVIRGGVGITVAPYNFREFASFAYANPGLPTSVTLSKANLQTYGLSYPVTNAQVANALTSSNGTVGYPVFDPKARSPYSIQWTADIQQRINAHSLFTVGYVGNKGLKIFATHYANLPDRTTGITPVSDSLQFQFRSGSDFSWYHALQASFEQRVWHGLQYQVNYTWSRAMAEQGGDFWLGSDFKAQDENNLRAERGPTSNHIPQRLTANLIYTLPSGSGHGWAGFAKRNLLGWTFSSIAYAQSGSPLDITESSTYAESRPDLTGLEPYAHGSRLTYLNANAFRQVPILSASGATARPGTVGKNAFRGPSSWSSDLSVAKRFPINEKVNFQFRAQAFNAFNHVRLGSPATEITKPSTFGLISGASDPRVVQLDARLQF